MVKEVVLSGTENPNDPNDPTHTNTELLCNPRGWVLLSATSSPAFPMLDGSYVTNLMDGFLYDFELDDYIKFLPDGTQIINGGIQVPAPNEPYQSQDYVYTWSFNSDETALNMQIPFLYDDGVETVSIFRLSETELRIKYTFNYVEPPVKYTCSFTLTYVPCSRKVVSAKSSGQYFSNSVSTVKTNGKCSDLNASSTTTDFDGTQTIEKTECK